MAPEQPAGDGKEYVRAFKIVSKVSQPEVAANRDAEELWRLVGGADGRISLNLASQVMGTDSWETVLTGMLNGIPGKIDLVKQDRRQLDTAISYRNRPESTDTDTLRDGAKYQGKQEYVVEHRQ